MTAPAGASARDRSPKVIRDLLRVVPGAPSALDRRDAMTVVALIAAAVLLPLAVGAFAGSLDIPRNDDWSYRGIAMRLYRTGRLELDGAVQAASLGLAFAVQPFLWVSGGAWWAFLVAGVAFDAIAVSAGYMLLRRLLARPLASLGISLVILFPAWLPFAISMMTDVPALAAQLVALGLGIVALSRPKPDWRWLTAAIVVGLYGYSIREFALAAPAAVVVAAILREPRRIRGWAAAAAVVVIAVGLHESRNLLVGVAGQFGAEPAAPLRLVPALCTLGLVMSPVTIVAALRWRAYWHRLDVVLGLGAGAILLRVQLVILAASPGDLRWVGGGFPHVLLYDLITQWGAPAADYLIGRRPVLFATWLWVAISAVAVLATILLAAVLGGVLGAHLRTALRDPRSIPGRLGSPLGLLIIYVSGSAAGIAAYGAVWPLFDRYLWPIVPPLAAMLLCVPDDLAPRTASPGPRATRLGLAGAGVQLTLLAAMSGIFLVNSDAFDAARWHAGESLVQRGYAAETIDAGPEWLGSHPTGLATAAHPVDGALNWWQSWWPDFRMCAFVSNSPVENPRYRLLETREQAYRLYLVIGSWKPLYLYGVSQAGCPAVTARP